MVRSLAIHLSQRSGKLTGYGTVRFAKNHQGVDNEDYEPEGVRMYATENKFVLCHRFKSMYPNSIQNVMLYGKGQRTRLMKMTVSGMKINL